MKRFLSNIFIIAFSLISIKTMAQNPAPAAPQSQAIVLKGGNIHTGNGNVIQNGAVAFDQGVITYLGTSTNFTLEGYEVINVEGKEIYPGLILCGTDLGLVEIGAVRATDDNSEVGLFNPESRAIIAYNTDSHVIPTTRVNGILMAQVAPRGRGFTGQSSIVQLDAWNWEDAALLSDEGIHLNWPSRYRYPSWLSADKSLKPNKDYYNQVSALETNLLEAAAYAKSDPKEQNIKFEAMKGLFDGSKKLYIHANNSKSIIEAIELAKKGHVKKIVLVEAADAWLIKDYLIANNIPVILSNVHKLPTTEDDYYDMPYSMPAMLTKAGVKVALMYSGLSNARNIPFFAGTASAYGLEKEEALQLITKNPAEILGIDQKFGTIEVGKSASIVVSEGDILDMRSNQITHMFIDGRSVSLQNKHHTLYKKYQQKYGQK